MDNQDLKNAKGFSDYLVIMGLLFGLITPVVVLVVSFCHLGYAQQLRILTGVGLYAMLNFLPYRVHRAFPMAFLRAHVIPTLLAIGLVPHGPHRYMAGLVVAIASMARSALAYSLKGTPPGKDGKLRILLTGDSFYPKVDGIATFSTRVIKHCVEHGHTVHVMYSKAGPERLFGAEVTRLPGTTHSVCPEASLTVPMPHKVHLALLRFRPHLVHLFEPGSMLNVFMVLYCWFLDVPTVMSHHTRLDHYIPHVVYMVPVWFARLCLRSLFRLLFQLSTMNISVDNSHVQPPWGYLFWARVPNDLPPQVWTTGADPNDFSPDHFQQSVREALTGQSPHLPVILHVGRLAGEKQSEVIPEVFLRTYQLLNGMARFAVIGDGPLSEKVIGQLRELLPKNAVYWPGVLRGDDLSQVYASSDVFFSPSTFDTFPVVFLEAMMSGLCVVGPNAGGVPDTFVNGVHGLHYAPRDLEDAAQKLTEVVNNRQRYSRNVRQHAHQYTWSKSMSELMGWYGDVCKAWGILSPKVIVGGKATE